ncbi:hypothetical protein F5Y08DRAFT_313400 [Xylaria arbuscula]|nr:hypothetical protein F5Y08DRAFT_313400 [Xylaria arbuscula]
MHTRCLLQHVHTRLVNDRSMPVAPGAYWDLLDRHTPPVKRRATHAKARTGCLTCKRRRVKCDEAKPHCTRCVKSGHTCAGYEESRTGSGAARKCADPADHDAAQSRGSRSRHPDRCAPAPLRPKPGAAATRAATVVVAAPPSSMEARHQRGAIDLLRASMTPIYFDVGDAMYFERFKSQVLADLGTWCGSEYWRHRILGEVLLNKMVQHAALASVAMVMDIEQQQQFAYARLSRKREREREGRPRPVVQEDPMITSKPAETLTTAILKNKVDGGQREGRGDDEEASLLPVISPSNITTHGKAALRHYTTSISLCRQSLAAEGITSATARPSLTATFFYAVLELVQGNVSEADRIFSSGVSLLDNALSAHVPDGRPAVVGDNELREIQVAFDRMRVTWGLCPYFGGKYRDNNNNNNNNDNSNNSNTKLLATISRSPAQHFELPSPDASVRTKQMFWNAFSSDFGQFMVDMQDMLYPSSPSPPSSSPPVVETISTIMAQRTKYLIQLRYWLPILSDLCAQDPDSAILATTKAYAQTAIIFLNCFLDRTELAYDAYLPIFKDIVSTYEHLLSSSPSHLSSSSSSSSSANTPASTHVPTSTSATYTSSRPSHLRVTLDVDLFHIITFTVSKCRDKTTRAAALRVFAQMTRHQALWTNSGMFAALRALADLEDAGRRISCDTSSSTAPDVNNADDGFVPPEARYRYVSSEWDFQSRRMVAVFLPVVTATMETSGAATAAVRVPIKF